MSVLKYKTADGKWLSLGAAVDLSDYYTKSEVDAEIANRTVTIEEVNARIDERLGVIENGSY